MKKNVMQNLLMNYISRFLTACLNGISIQIKIKCLVLSIIINGHYVITVTQTQQILSLQIKSHTEK